MPKARDNVVQFPADEIDTDLTAELRELVRVWTRVQRRRHSEVLKAFAAGLLDMSTSQSATVTQLRRPARRRSA